MAFGTDDNQEQKPNEGTDQTTQTNGAPATTELPPEVQKKIDHQDAFIETLKQEKKEQEERLIELLEKQVDNNNRAMTREDIQGLFKDLKSTEAAPPAEPSPEKEISIEEITQSVGDKLKEEALANKQAANLAESMKAAELAHGPEFDTVVTKAAVDRGMTVQQLNDMASNSPQIFAELFIPKAPDAKPDTGNTNAVAGFDQSRAPERKSIRNMSTNNRAAYIKQLMDSQK